MTDDSRLHRYLRPLGVAFLLGFTLLIGCTDLGEVTQFAQASANVGKTFPAMASAAKDACARANTFAHLNNNNLPDLDCSIYDKLNAPLEQVNDTLFDYIASIGKLASKDVSGTAGGLKNVSTDLKQADPTISTDNQNKASAATSLATAITNIWASSYRQHELEKIVSESNGHVRSVADFLSDYAADKFRQSFEDEWRYENSYCSVTTSTTEPIALDLLRRMCSRDKERIDRQLAAVKAYQVALQTIAETHDKLNGERGHWDLKQLSKEIGPQIVSLGSSAVTINKAF